MHAGRGNLHSVKILDDHHIALSGVGTRVNQPAAIGGHINSKRRTNLRSQIQRRGVVGAFRCVESNQMTCSRRRTISKTDIISATAKDARYVVGELIERQQKAHQFRKGETVMLSDYVFHRGGALIASLRRAWASAPVRSPTHLAACSITWALHGPYF